MTILSALNAGLNPRELLASTHHIAHGTTSSLNALVTGNVPPVVGGGQGMTLSLERL